MRALDGPGIVCVGARDDDDNLSIAGRLADEAAHLRLEVVPAAGHLPLLEEPGWLPRALTRVLLGA